MGIDHPVRLILLVEIIQHQAENKVFEHVGMVASMKSVTITEHYGILRQQGGLMVVV